MLETFNDWQVSCAVQNKERRCVLLQQQSQKNGQRVLAIELTPTNANAITGVLVLPFGLLLDNGVVLRLGDKPLGNPLRFRTCLPSGCLVLLSFDAATVKNLRHGKTLEVEATVDSDHQHTTGGLLPLPRKVGFSVSLTGFSEGLDRITTIARN